MGKLPFPNNVIEDFLYFGGRQFTAPPKPEPIGLSGMIEYILEDVDAFCHIHESVAAATSFDFSNVSLSAADIKTNFDFAVRLLKDDLFTLPFPECLFILSDSEAVLMLQGEKDQRSYSDGLIITPCVYCPVVKGTPQRLLLPLGSMTNMSSLWSFIEEKRMPTEGDRIGVKWAQFFKQGGISLAFSGDTRLYERVTMELVKLALACNQLLMSPHVKTNYEPAPIKLNQTRVKRGRPVIGDRYKITLRNFAVKRDPSSRMSTGTHASPTPHWRRGHLRHLDDGRIIPVIPTVVGASGSQSEIGRKMYEYARRKE